MFDTKPYYEVNREERFFCFLFAHALLSSNALRERFANLIESKFNFRINPKNFEVYVEAAILRDYWHDLGDPMKYKPETHDKRRKWIETILNHLGLSESIIDKYNFFWTAGQNSKLWSPGRWNEASIKKAELEELKIKKVIQVKWAFNTKPDIMIISDSSVLLIEAKVESGEGRNEESGYQQYEIQELISYLVKLLVPQYSKSNFLNTVLKLIPQKTDLSWQEVLSLIQPSEIDEFSMKCLSEFSDSLKQK